MKKYKFRKSLFGGYGYTIYYSDRTFVSIPFNTPLEALKSLRRNL